jgi:uncharacterized protein (TIGR02145 family)
MKIETIDVGTQKWAAKNLNLQTFQNGDEIPLVEDAEQWLQFAADGKPACCLYDNSKAMAKYGLLYNGFAIVDPRGLAPAGFRIPTVEDILALAAFMGHERSTEHDLPYFKELGTHLKSTKLWKKEFYSFPGDDKTGLNFLPSGYRTPKDAAFLDKGRSSNLWLSGEIRRTSKDVPVLWSFNLGTYTKDLGINSHDCRYGSPVRLIGA